MSAPVWTIDLAQHLLRQMAFSHAAFGPGARTDGVIDHIRKELDEIRESGGSASEWVDVVILALDGLTRQLKFASSNGLIAPSDTVAAVACHLILSKQERNEARTWPDWRTAAPDKAIEHVRSGEDLS